MAKKELSPWLKSTLGSFVATVLGIALTLGVSKLVDIKNNREMQRQCVFNVLTDLDNACRFIRRDSTTLAELGEWLPDYMERYSTGEAFSVDSAYTYFLETAYYPLYQLSKYTLVGRDIMSSIVPSNETDMAIHRKMELAYALIGRTQKCTDQLYELFEYMRQMRIKITYTPAEKLKYDKVGIVKLFMDDAKVVTLTEMVWQLDGAKTYGAYLNAIQVYHDQILNMSGITEEEFEAYLADIVKLQGK